MIDRMKSEIKVTGGDGPGEIGRLKVTFIIPDGGALGTDKKVTIGEATAAKVEYRRGGVKVPEEQMTTSEAVALIEQAQRDEVAAQQRAAARAANAMSEYAELTAKFANLRCTVCGYGEFEDRKSYQSSLGLERNDLQMRLLVCKRCGFTFQFTQPKVPYFPPLPPVPPPA
jgi:predicted Zn-ribbon and HTH transcriptional regulator